MNSDRDTRMHIKEAIAYRHEPEAARVLGETLWAIIIMFLALVTSVSIAFGVYEMRTPLVVEAESSSTVGARKTISRAELIKILEIFNMRAEEYETRRIQSIPIKDPS